MDKTINIGTFVKIFKGFKTISTAIPNPTSIALACSVGHAVATAHMTDHFLGTTLYALKAVKHAGKSIDAELKWQNEQLPLEIKKLVHAAKESKKFNKI